MTTDNTPRTTERLELIDVSWLIDHHVAKLQERQQMVADLQFKPGEVMLDLGCGPGLWSQLIAEYVQPHGRVVGVDLDPALIHYARKDNEASPLKDNIEFHDADFYSIPFESNTFDHTFFGNCFTYVTDPLKTLAEQKRVAKPGGRVITKDFDGAVIIFHPVDPLLSAKVLWANARALDERPPDQPFDNFVGRKMHGFLLEAGLKDVTTTSYAIQKLAPLIPEAKRYISGNAQWYAQTGEAYLTAEEMRQWMAYFDPNSADYILDREDFFFCMVEMVTVGIV